MLKIKIVTRLKASLEVVDVGVEGLTFSSLKVGKLKLKSNSSKVALK